MNIVENYYFQESSAMIPAFERRWIWLNKFKHKLNNSWGLEWENMRTYEFQKAEKSSEIFHFDRIWWTLRQYKLKSFFIYSCSRPWSPWTDVPGKEDRNHGLSGRSEAEEKLQKQGFETEWHKTDADFFHAKANRLHHVSITAIRSENLAAVVFYEKNRANNGNWQKNKTNI